MTHEQRLVVPLTDIRGVHWQCGCGATMTIPIDQTLRIPTQCPGCRDAVTFGAPSAHALEAFLQGLKAAIRVMRDTNGRPTLSLDVTGPDRVS